MVSLDELMCRELGFDSEQCRRWRRMRQAQWIAFWAILGLTIVILTANSV